MPTPGWRRSEGGASRFRLHSRLRVQPPQRRIGGLMKAPLFANESNRLKTLAEYHILDSAPEQAFDDLTALAAQICGCEIALVSIVDQDRQWFKSRVGLEVSE